MTNRSSDFIQDCVITSGCVAVERLIQPRDQDLGGFSVRRLLPAVGCRRIGPWVFLDHLGPAHFPAGQGIDVRPHPHIHLATVTYLFAGEMLHRDSLGNRIAIQPGAINLMVAGRGIVHSERERPEVTAVAHTLHGLQLWLALPEADEDREPAFHHYPASRIPSVVVDGVPIRLMMGSAFGITSPVQTFARTVYLEAHLKRGQRLALPDATERAIYVVQGRLTAATTTIPEHTLAVLHPAPDLILEAFEETHLILIGGEPVGHRFMDWNFVSSSQARIAQAKADWQAGRFPVIPDDHKEFIPLPGTH